MNDREDRLRFLDPGFDDPGYWTEFRRTVMQRARSELARRRDMVKTTVADVLSAWSRSLIPTALAAAAVATFVILSERGVEADTTPLALEEELLATETTDGLFTAVLDGTTDWAPTAFMTLVEENRP